MMRLRRPVAMQEAEIPTASMADISFLLIVFFMATAVFARDKGMKLAVPPKTEETKVVKLSGKKLMKISINDQGQVFVGDQPVEVSQIPDLVRQHLAETPDAVILIRTHERAPYGRMIEVFDEVRKVPEATRVALKSIRAES